MFIFSKVFNFFLNPFAWVILLILLALLKAEKRKRYIIMALCVIFIFGNRIILNSCLQLFETKSVGYPIVKDTSQYGIVLCGAGAYNDDVKRHELNAAAERYVETVVLYKKGLFKNIIISGGSANIIKPFYKESYYVKLLFINLGIPEKHIFIDSISRNTYENAIESKKIIVQNNWQKQNGWLITSALHMPRSKMLFYKVGLSNLNYFSVDTKANFSPKYKFNDYCLPSIQNILAWQDFMHELVGILFFKIKN